MVPTATDSRVDELISTDCQRIIREEIASVGGAEIFFIGRLDRDLCIEEVESYAFGNRRSVPALMQYAKPGEVILHNHPSGTLEPSEPDIEIASVAGERAVASYIINNDCSEVRVVVKAMAQHGAEPLDVEKLIGMLRPGGRLADGLPGYEHREPQIEMTRRVAEALNGDAISVIEAPTGTGKSMAYLLPAVAWAIKNGEKVVVATHTINLQEQLIEKDLPLLRQAAGLEFDAAVIKGRNNYVCLRKTDYVRGHRDFIGDEAKTEQTEAIEAWIKTTGDGSLAELGFEPDREVWERYMSETDNCLRVKCPFYQKCFYYNARRRAARAHVLVANHHLLMADLAIRSQTDNYSHAAVLPRFHRIVIDEAHHLEEVATQYFGSRISRAGLLYHLRRLASTRTGDGLLRHLAQKIHQRVYRFEKEKSKAWILEIDRDLMGKRMSLEEEIDDLAERSVRAMAKMEDGSAGGRKENRRRVTPGLRAKALWETEIHAPLMEIFNRGRALVADLRRLYQALGEVIEDETPETMSPILELRSVIMKIERQLAEIIQFLDTDSELCRWVEYRSGAGARRPHVAFCTAPMEVSESLRERVLRRFRTVIMTSATLTVARKFDYFLKQIGAEDQSKLGLLGPTGPRAPRPIQAAGPRRLVTALLDSPFDYDAQVYAAAPIDLPSPKMAEFAPALEEFLRRALKISRGRAFVLFTSYTLLNRMHDSLAADLQAEGYPCLKQGTIGRTVLTEAFRRDIGSVLFATSSFWEGVDIPGEALSCLVLTRLPFVVPNEPIIEARVEVLRAKGGDAFGELIVPRAVIRFRQGFGRLIRSKQDRGCVLICDRRVASERYGKIFLDSLPTRNVHLAPAEDVFATMERFFDDFEDEP